MMPDLSREIGRSRAEILSLLSDLAEVYAEFDLEMPSLPEVPTARHPIVVIFGPPGAGKTAAFEILKARFGGEGFPERVERNKYLRGSYSQDDPEIALRSQITFLLLKFQVMAEAIETSLETNVFIDQSARTDHAYALTFRQLERITEEQLRRYIRVWELMEPFMFQGDLAISIIPPRPVLDRRISGRGRDYERLWTPAFKDSMIALCQEEERLWQQRGLCLRLGDLDYVHGGLHKNDKILLIREFGLTLTDLFGGEHGRTSGGSRILWPAHWSRFSIPRPGSESSDSRKKHTC